MLVPWAESAGNGVRGVGLGGLCAERVEAAASLTLRVAGGSLLCSELRAEVAELADALGSGSSGRKVVGVQVPPSAPDEMQRVTEVEQRVHSYVK
jgi:hypothetical protein